MEVNDPVALEKALNEKAQKDVFYTVRLRTDGHMEIRSVKRPLNAK
jgi:hypothetical protein